VNKMPDNNVIEKLDTVIEGVVKAQEVASRNEKRIDALDNEQIKKINDDVTANLDELNTIKAKQEEQDKVLKSIEELVSKPKNASIEQEVSAEAKSEFGAYLRRGTVPTEKSFEEYANAYVTKAYSATSVEKELMKKDLVVGNSENGGYLVYPEIANWLITRLFETSPMRQIATVRTVSAESLIIPIDDNEASAEWVGEIDSRSVTNTPAIGQLQIHTHELAAKPRASQKMLDDAAYNIEEWLQNKLVDEFSRMENTAFVVGDGSKKPRGFLDYPAWTTPGTYERFKVETLDSGTNGGFDDESFIDLQNSLLEEYQPNATWTMKRATFGEVMKLKDSQGQYLLNPMILSQGAEKILLGSPVVFFNDMGSFGVTDAKAVAYGDFRMGYTILDRMGIRILRDPYFDKPYILYYTTKRVGGDVTNYQSLKIMKLTA
jgi:HK97 family phage major capsid protein